MKDGGFILLMIVILLEKVNSFGRVDFNDECEFLEDDVIGMNPFNFNSPSKIRYDEYKFCDSDRGLFCVPGLGKCGCYVPNTIYRGGKCRAKVSAGCVVKDFKLDCVENADCTRNSTSFTFRCQCKRGYLHNAENTACFDRSSYSWRTSTRYGYRDGYYYWGGSQFLQPSTFTLISFVISILILSF